MNRPLPLALLCALGVIFAACYEDRPLLIVVGSDGSAASDPQGGAAGVGGGTTGAAGAGGDTGAFGGAGPGGSGGTGDVPLRGGCNVAPLFQQKYSCTIAGACHDAHGSAAGLDLATAGWEQRLLGRSPSGSTPVNGQASMCTGRGKVYLVPGSQPAVGLLLEKLEGPPSCGNQMPLLGGPMTATDLDCVQRWANALTAP